MPRRRRGASKKQRRSRRSVKRRSTRRSYRRRSQRGGDADASIASAYPQTVETAKLPHELVGGADFDLQPTVVMSKSSFDELRDDEA